MSLQLVTGIRTRTARQAQESRTLPMMDRLRSQNIAVTGHLACMSRRQAAGLLRSVGGIFHAAVNQRTNFLVVGSWPLKADGRLTSNLRAARELQRQSVAITMLSEDEFLSELGLQGQVDSNR